MTVPELTAAQAEVYDRQLRVWGVETQKRLTSAKVLIAGCTGLAAEVAKNIVLAGVGSLALVDDTPLALSPPGTFLAQPGGTEQTVAEACTTTLQEMNPLVSVKAVGGSPASALGGGLEGYDIVLLFNQPAGVAARADELCRATGTPLFVAACRGIFGWAFADLHEHAYVVETEKEQEDGTKAKVTEPHSASYPTWGEAMTCSTAGMNLRRVPPLYFLLRVVAAFEQDAGRLASLDDLPALLEAKARLVEGEGLQPSVVDDRGLESYAGDGEGLPAISAVVGGVLANEVLKAVSKKGEPLQNLFLFSLVDGAGAVARMPPL